MALGPPIDSILSVAGDPQVCSECQSVSRLTNGLCLNCLLRGALTEENNASGRDAFKQVLAAVKSRDGDWHIADHEILHELARGGMGVVYQAREPHSGRIVALKCVLAYQGDSDHVVARFRREAETAARLDHPNIIPIYQIGETADGFPYYTMKYAAGGSLVQARGPLRQHPHQTAELMMKVARAVQFAHEKGVLHRDLKPGNILLDNRGEPLVSDFGLARCEAVSSYLTRSLSSFGTPGYIAPEQADGPAASLTPAADIYSLGAILFELLTGRTPFLGENAFAVMKKSAEEPAPKVRSLAPRVDRDLERICDRCLKREPMDRYQTAAALADDLQSWLSGKPIRADRLAPWRRARRWTGRHPRLAALIVVGALLLGAISVGWQIRARRNAAAVHENVLASRSSVVLPFLDLDRVVADAGLARSIAGSLQHKLAPMGPARIDVADTGSVLNWSGVDTIRSGGKPTTARTVVTGTIRTVQNQRRVSLRLVNTASGDLLFSKVWETDPTGSPEVSDQFARELYATLSATDWSHIARARTDPGYQNPAAKDSIVAGRDLSTHASNASEYDGAIALFQAALRIEPNSALAHAYLSIAATARTHYNGDSSFLDLGEAEADKALALAPDSTDAHRARAGVYYQQGKFGQALEEQLRTIEVGGVEEKTVNFIGHTLSMLGRPDLALKWCRVPLTTARLPGEVYWLIGHSWGKLADDERALAAYRRAVELRRNIPEPFIGASRLHLLQRDFPGAQECLRKAPHNTAEPGEIDQLAAQIEFFARDYHRAEQLYQALFKDDPDGGASFWGAITYRSALARIRQELAGPGAADDLIAESLAKQSDLAARQPSNPEAIYRLAAVEAMAGRPEAALGHLRDAARHGWIDYRSLQLDPRFDRVRAEPEFDRIVTSISNRVGELRAEAQKQTND